MMSLRTVVLTVVLAAAGMLGMSRAEAANMALVIAAEDADPTSVRRDHQVMRRVLAALTEMMNTRGFDIYDETAACMEITEPGRVRRKDTELIAVIRQCAAPAIPGMRPRPPIDALVILELFITERQAKSAGGMWFATPRVAGRVLSVRTGQHLGGFEVGGEEIFAGPRSSDETTRLNRIGSESRLFAEKLGMALADKLAALNVVGPDGCAGRSQDYVLTFTGFPREQMTKVEELMMRFGCYRAHRPLKADAGRVQYYYATHAAESSILTNLRTLMEYLEAKGDITKTAAGEYLVTRHGTR